MPSQTKLPGLAGQSAQGGTVSWNSTTIRYDDGNFADTSSSINVGTITYMIYGYDYGFTIPGGATIDGIIVQAEVTRRRDDHRDRYVKTYRYRLVDAGGISLLGSDEYDDGNVWVGDGSSEIKTAGGASDLWGATLTPADVNDSDFGVGIQAIGVNPCSWSYAAVDYIKMTVYYSESVYYPKFRAWVIT